MESLNVYIPADRRVALSKGETLPDRAHGAVLFTDISGFTTFTETLSRELGPQRGAEEVTRQLNSILSALIQEVHRYRGSVISFSGDGITCWFDGDDGRRAATCALAMQKRMPQFQNVPIKGGTAMSVALKAGVAAGPVRRFLVGTPRIRSIEVLAGSPLERVAAAERLAQRGEVVVASEVIRNLQAEKSVLEWRTSQTGERFAVVGAIRQPAPETPWGDLPVLPAQQARDWLLPAIYERLQSGAGEFLAEIRPVVALFMKLTGIDFESDESGSQLDGYVRWVEDVLARYEGNLLELVIGDKGSHLYATFGAPQAHEDDAFRAASAALELQKIPPELAYIDPPQIGLSLGQMRTGSYGSPERRSYSAQGAQTNLASRLMGSAEPGQILVTQAVRDAARSDFEFEPLGALSLKGMSQPVPTFALRGQVRHRAASDVLQKHAQTGMFGRENERTYLSRQLEALQRGEELPLVFIQGEAGIGKSRLVADLMELATAAGIPCWIGEADAIEKSTPYLAWRSVFTRFFGLEGLSEAAAPEEVEAARRQVIDLLIGIDASLAPLAPLLNVFLPFYIPDNELTSELSGEARANQTQDLCLTLFKHATRNQPHLLIMEDAHWLDSSSWALLRLASRDVPSLLVVTAMRPVQDPAPPDLDRMLARPNVQTLSLESLPAEEIERLICHRLNVSSLPPEVSRFIRDRAEGHPFFSEELAYALRDTGLIVISDGACQLAPDAGDLHQANFPDTIDGVIISRIDSLPAQEQLLLKVASVIGRIFALRILRDVHPVESDRAKLPEYLSHLQSLDITPLESPEPDLAYIFKHIITREVTYNLLLFAQRRELHRVVAEWFESARTDDMSSFYPLLVHHWRLAEEDQKTIEYLAKAGEQAFSLGANQEVITFLRDALELNQKEQYVTDRLVLADWEQKIGYAYLSTGQVEKSIEHFGAALAHLGRQLPKSQGGYVTGLLAGIIRQTVHRLWRRRLGSSPEPEVNLKAAHIFRDLGVAVYHTSNPIAAMYVTVSELNEAEKAPPSGLLGNAYGAMAVVAGFLSPYSLAPVYVKLAKQAMGVASPQEAGFTSELLAMYNLGIGDWAEAEKLAEEAYHVYANTGNFRRWEELTSIYSSTLLPQGKVERALELRRELERLSLRAENPQSQVWALVQQAEIAMQQDRLGDAIPLLERAVTLADKIGSADQVWVYGVLAAARLWCGQPERAQEAAALSQALILKTMPNAFYALEGYAGVAEVGITLWDTDSADQTAAAKAARASLKGLKQFAMTFPIGRPRALLWEGMYFWKQGDHTKARKLWQKGLELTEKNRFAYEEGVLRRVIATHMEAGDPARVAHLQRAVQLFSSIGATREAHLSQSALGS
ncbi:MAG TPA: AAA family ATPase [Anaerolineales bacterium]|nr:AAA family ATPase [Anaerolineales bacterium]